MSEGDVVKVMCAEYICNVTVKDGGHYTSRIDPYKIGKSAQLASVCSIAHLSELSHLSKRHNLSTSILHPLFYLHEKKFS